MVVRLHDDIVFPTVEQKCTQHIRTGILVVQHADSSTMCNTTKIPVLMHAAVLDRTVNIQKNYWFDKQTH